MPDSSLRWTLLLRSASRRYRLRVARGIIAGGVGVGEVVTVEGIVLNSHSRGTKDLSCRPLDSTSNPIPTGFTVVGVWRRVLCETEDDGLKLPIIESGREIDKMVLDFFKVIRYPGLSNLVFPPNWVNKQWPSKQIPYGTVQLQSHGRLFEMKLSRDVDGKVVLTNGWLTFAQTFSLAPRTILHFHPINVEATSFAVTVLKNQIGGLSFLCLI
ncbi:hypothetical protein QVD17_23565 [Tagetes erecta]|uniref:TF-B3 domain-containing protein n=1 Tax=Tagetes erecta TaxID=13708 RepID=A0AAD8NUC9_TARER|nr:hypothetical protein QVD17_23565 [Tagetes erecta]